MSARSAQRSLRAAGCCPALETVAAWLLAVLWMLPLRMRSGRHSIPPSISARFALLAPADAGEFRARLGCGAVRALLPQHVPAGHADPRLPARAVHAGGLRLRALRVSRQRRRVRAGAGAADDHAGRADRRELQDHEQARHPGLHSRPSPCRMWPPRSAYSCCGRHSRPCRRSSTTRRASRAATPCRRCSRSTCRWRSRSISPTASSRSAITGTTSCGR